MCNNTIFSEQNVATRIELMLQMHVIHKYIHSHTCICLVGAQMCFTTYWTLNIKWRKKKSTTMQYRKVLLKPIFLLGPCVND